MLRVLVTMMHSEYRAAMESQKQDLQNWIVEILQASYPHTNVSDSILVSSATLVHRSCRLLPRLQTTTGLLPNYLGEDTFSEAASTALMASVSYRMGQLGLDTSTIANAHAARKAVFGAVDPATGWLTSVVNPRDWSAQGEESAEGQSFTLLLAAAYRDYVNTTNDVGDDIPIATGTSTLPSPTSTSTTTGAASHRTGTSLAILLVTVLSTLVLLLE